MKFYCETYHEERDTEHCVFCSAACNQRPLVKNTKETEELLQDKEKKIGVYGFVNIKFIIGKTTLALDITKHLIKIR